ncbi:MAG: hypothetical protein KDE22_03865 [Rhodobacterales bacterium]|nr:hypothetical protein [Rhodobacterales bacterium]
MFRKLTAAALIAAVAVAAVPVDAFAAGAPAPGSSKGVSFNMAPRAAGNGYSAARPTRTVGAPKGILKSAPAPRASFTKFSNGFARQGGAIDTLKKGQAAQNKRFELKKAQAGPRVQRNVAKNADTLRHRGDVAKNARKSPQIKKTLAATATKSTKTVKTTKTVAKSAKTAKTVAKTAKTAKSVTKVAKTLKNVGKVAAGGGLGVMAFEAVVGEDIPDVFDAAEWTIGTLKDPKNAGKRFKKLGQDTVAKTTRIAKTLTDPKKMVGNVKNTGKKIGNTTKKVSKTIGKGAKKAGKAIGKAFKKVKLF